MKNLIALSATFLCGMVGILHASAAPASLRVLPEYSVLKAGSDHRTVLKIIIEGADLPPAAERAPLNLSLVIDTSGSMGGDRIANARRAALELVSRLDENDIFSLVTYDSTARVLVPAGPVEDRAAIERMIRGLRAGGMTALYAGVETGAEELTKYQSNQYTNRMIMISDGRANVGPSRPEGLAALGAQLGNSGIILSTIGLGLGYNEDLMTLLADRSGGNAYFVEGAAELPGIVDREIGQALAIVLNRATIRIQLPEGVRPVRLIGRSGNINEQVVEATMPPLYRKQTRHLLLEVDIAADASTTPLNFSQTSAEIVRAGSEHSEVIRAEPVELRFSAKATDVEASLNQSVQATRLLDEVAVARDQAIALQDAGDQAGAADALMKVVQLGLSAPATRNNQALEAEFAALEEQSNTLRTRRLDTRERKVMRASSYEQLNRQVQREAVE